RAWCRGAARRRLRRKRHPRPCRRRRHPPARLREPAMDFELSDDQRAIQDAINRVCARFGADYWLQKDRDGGFPHEFHAAIAADGWLGIAMPERYGGSGLGITEAALMMEAIAASGAGFSGASAIHMNIFGLHPVVVYATGEQKQRWLPPLIAGIDKACFGVTEPGAGLN